MYTRIENLVRNTGSIQSLYSVAPDSIKKLLLNLRAIPLVKLRYSKDTFRLRDIIMERDEWHYDQLIEYVNNKLSEDMGRIKGIPYYSTIAKNLSSLKDFPILTRDAVRENADKMIGSSIESLLKVFTSGTSGSGLPVYYDNDAYCLNWAYAFKKCNWANVDPRDWRITFFGAKIIPEGKENPPFWMKNYFEHQYLMSIFHLSEDNAKHYVNFLEEQQGLVIEGFPTTLYLIAKFISSIKGKMQFKAVFSTGEPLYPFMRKEIEKAFSAKVYDNYGMTEWAGRIMECSDGGQHVLLDYGNLEIINENGNPVSKGEEGYFTWTGFTNKAMPFIRYKIGDRGIWKKEHCSCGRPYPLVKATITRDSDYLVCKNGILLSPRAVNQVLKNKTTFQSCQFVQKSINEIVIRIVPDSEKGFNKELMTVKKALKTMVGDGVIIQEEIAEQPIKRGGQGKIPLIISSLDPVKSQDKKQ